MSSLLNDLHTSYKWTLEWSKRLFTASNSETKSPKFAMAYNPKIEWFLVLRREKKPRIRNCSCDCCSEGDSVFCCTRSAYVFSLYLQTTKADQKPVSINIDFSILGAHNEKLLTRYSKISGLIVNGKQYGIDRFISETDMFDSFLVNNRLNILCEIKPTDDTCSGNLSFLKGFDSFIDDETFSDVVLLIGEKKIYAHKLILSFKSPVFRQMFLTDMKESNSNEAKVHDIKFEVFNELLRFMYIGKVEKLDELGLEIFKAAHFYQIDDLKLICEQVLCKTLKIENSIDVLKLADDYNAEVLKRRCVTFILNQLTAVLKTATFQNLHETHPHLPSELLVELGSLFKNS